MYLSLHVRSRAGNVIVDIAGDIDMNSGPWLEDSLYVHRAARRLHGFPVDSLIRDAAALAYDDPPN